MAIKGFVCLDWKWHSWDENIDTYPISKQTWPKHTIYATNYVAVQPAELLIPPNPQGKDFLGCRCRSRYILSEKMKWSCLCSTIRWDVFNISLPFCQKLSREKKVLAIFPGERPKYPAWMSESRGGIRMKPNRVSDTTQGSHVGLPS